MWSVQDLFILCIVLSNVTRAAGLIHVFGYVGRDVNVSCSYDQGYESYEKYLCKNDCGDSDVLIKTSEPKKNKYSIYDDKKKQTLTVTISDLQSMDAGKYWCGVTRTGKDIYTKVKLELKQDETLYVAVIVPVLLLILIVVLIIVLKYKCHKVQEAGVGIIGQSKAAGIEEGAAEGAAERQFTAFLWSKAMELLSKLLDMGAVQTKTHFGVNADVLHRFGRSSR